MRIVLLNPPYHAVTSRYGTGEQVPLGLLSIGGALLDAGYDLRLVDAEARHLPVDEAVTQVIDLAPDLLMTGHAGSTPAHATVVAATRAIKELCPNVPIVYGGIYPTYHGRDILEAEPSVDVIVRGEGELTAVRVATALEHQRSLADIRGIMFRDTSRIVETAPAEMLIGLDNLRVGWELIDNWDLYQCWGLGRSAIVQLSRGCPHQCTYCGQRGYWSRWRYRTPELVAEEIAWLHRNHGVNFVDLADENPTTARGVWRRFLNALIAEKLPVKLFATLRASDIVRDKDNLHLYKQAGFECFLMGMETMDEATMQRIRKGSSQQKDYEAVQLLRQHGILSMVGHVAGFEDEKFLDYWRSFRQLLLYDPDLINAMYVTPHRWTPFYEESAERRVVMEDSSKWDYRHQLLATKYLKPWQVFLSIKTIEFLVQIRPKVIWRLLFGPDKSIRRAYRWCVRNAAKVWLDEIHDFVFRSKYSSNPRTLIAFWGRPRPDLEYALNTPPNVKREHRSNRRA